MEKTLSEFRPLSEIDLQAIRAKEWPALDSIPVGTGATYLQPLFRIEEFTVADRSYRTLLVALTSDKKGENLVGYIQASAFCGKPEPTVTTDGAEVGFLIPFNPSWVGHNSVKYTDVMNFCESKKGLKIKVTSYLVRSRQGRIHPLTVVEKA